MRLLFTFFLLLSILHNARADQAPPGNGNDSLLFLSTAVSNEAYHPQYRWLHRAILYKAAGVDLRRDTGSLLSQRMQLFWQQHAYDTVSQKWESPLLLHQLLRHAIHYENGVMLLDAIRWGIDINRVDTASRQTLVDFLEEEYRNYIKQPSPDWLREYKQVLVQAGAKYFTEIDFRMRRLAKNYERIRPPVHGLFAVRAKGKWGWVDENNKVVIPLQYQSVRYNTDSLFEVSKDSKIFYYINRKNIHAGLLPQQ